MEQVVYHLLQIINKNCLKSLPWPVTTPKEAAEFRNSATSIINVSIKQHSHDLLVRTLAKHCKPHF